MATFLKKILPAALAFMLTGTTYLFGQGVGLVLSGGGAAGIAHIGVIKALEENEVPIDYIAGTSMGALIGGLYAAGYSVDEITAFAKSEEFLLAIEGSLPEEDLYYFTKDLEDASIIRIKVNPKKLLKTNLPTNLVTPDLMEYMLMDLLSGPAAVANYDFDSLMVPFRCVAADIAEKEEVIFSQGSLALAIRASSTYPFYFKPVSVDGKLLFDGGLYNNFPADVMYDEFLPDYIIGSNVASVIEPPQEDDLVSQIRNMIMNRTDFSLKCPDGVVIEPQTNVEVFDFSSIDQQINIGYYTALMYIDEILDDLGEDRLRTVRESEEIRDSFRKKVPKKEVKKVTVTGRVTEKQKDYLKSMVGPVANDTTYLFEDFKPHFLRMAQDGKVRYVQPIATYNEGLSGFDVGLNVQPEKDFTLYFGGNFSSRPINFGYVGVKYNLFGRTSASIMANSYFGKFYGSLLLRADVDFGGRKRFSIAPMAVLNRWDYFRSYATFFELSRPSFIVKNETYGGIEFKASLGNNAVFISDLNYGETEDRYYQTENFTVEDTADYTQFTLGTIGIGIDRNTLNRKVYPNSGTRLRISARGVIGEEFTQYGTTRDAFEFTDDHSWIEAKLEYENYFAHFGPLDIALDFEGLYSTKPFFENYTASVISAPAYTPIPESKTIFLDEFRATEYMALGLKSVFEIRKNFEFRLEGYAFQPGREIIRDGNNDAEFSNINFEERYYIAASALVFHSPLGPVSLNLNYYDSRSEGPWSFFFNFGYTIFNQSVYKL